MKTIGMEVILKIITIDSPFKDILAKKTEDIQADELPLAKEISETLFAALKPHLPAAGLAAPQIGISKSIFIFSFDRDPKNLETVINPSFTPLDNVKLESWEACFSVILSNSIYKIAKIPRYVTILVTYMNLAGEKIEKNLTGFASKVFQHEYDHLQGIANIFREDALIKEFETKEELNRYMDAVKKAES